MAANLANNPTENIHTAPRPTLITILAILNILGGLSVFITQLVAWGNLKQAAIQSSISITQLLLGFIFLAVLSVSSGIGMWLGQKWGWWLGAFNELYVIPRRINVLLAALSMYSGTEGDELTRIIRSAGQILVSIVLLFYFYRHNVLDYFGLAEFPKWKSIIILFGGLALVILIFYLLG